MSTDVHLHHVVSNITGNAGRIALDQTAVLEEAAGGVREGGGQRVQLGAPLCRQAAKAQRAVGNLLHSAHARGLEPTPTMRGGSNGYLAGAPIVERIGGGASG